MSEWLAKMKRVSEIELTVRKQMSGLIAMDLHKALLVGPTAIFGL